MKKHAHFILFAFKEWKHPKFSEDGWEAPLYIDDIEELVNDPKSAEQIGADILLKVSKAILKDKTWSKS